MNYIKLINSIATSVSGKALTQMLQSVGRVAISTVVALVVFASPATAQTYFYHNDHLGTPQALTDGDQSIVWQAEYDPFGKATETVSTVEQNLRFPGQYLDRDTGLHYNYYRTYDPEVGWYLESDPIGLGGGINTYGYAYQNPVLYTDPTGEAVPAVVWWAAGALWTAIEFAGSAHDVYDTVNTFTNECSTTTDKVVAGGLLAAGILGPGFGYSKIDNVANSAAPLKNASGNLDDAARAARTQPHGTGWNLGSGKSAQKWANQMEKRGWSSGQITEATARGQ